MNTVRITIEGKNEWVVSVPPFPVLRGPIAGLWSEATGGSTELIGHYDGDLFIVTDRKYHKGNLHIQNTLNTALIAIEDNLPGVHEDSIVLELTEEQARRVAATHEFHRYLLGAPDALEALHFQNNPNRRYGLTPFLYF